MAETRNIDVVVIGSLNHDIVAGVTAGPGPGETVLAHTLTRTNGGKGGNQAAAAAREGASVLMVSSIGADAEGDMQIEDLAGRGIDVRGVIRQADRPTSLALIWVTPDGENSIIVTPGAKDCLTPELVREKAATLFSDSTQAVRIVLAQSEVGSAVCDAAADIARELAARFILSCGPVVLPSKDTLRRCDPVIVNTTEARDLLQQLGSVADVPEDMLAQTLLTATGASSVVVTLGAKGSLLAQAGVSPIVIEPVAASRVVDTTGAGDTYCGVLAARLALGGLLPDACRRATAAAAESVSWLGARPHPNAR